MTGLSRISCVDRTGIMNLKKSEMMLDHYLSKSDFIVHSWLHGLAINLTSRMELSQLSDVIRGAVEVLCAQAKYLIAC